MEQVFISVLNNAITVSILIVAVIVVRALAKKMPKWIACMLWMIVAVKLVVPVPIESALSLVPAGEPIVVANQSFTLRHMTIVDPMHNILHIGGLVWIIGVAVLLTYAATTYILIRKRVRASVKIAPKVYECDDISDSFILGIISPRVYIPSALSEEARGYILKHEFAHLSRHDQIWKPLGFVILSVYWFNPLCWVAYILLCKDIEYACDEKVTKNIGEGEKADYCRILLENSMPRRMIAACPVAFGGTNVKDRIKNVVNYKKPAFWITLASVMACAVVGACFATNKSSENVNEIVAASDISMSEGSEWIGKVKTPDSVLRLRKEPSEDSEAVGFIEPDSEIIILDEVDGWYKINLEEGDCYINGDYVEVFKR